jgi:hypothetical protein
MRRLCSEREVSPRASCPESRWWVNVPIAGPGSQPSTTSCSTWWRGQAISPGIPARLLPLTPRTSVGLDRPGGRFLKLPPGEILGGSTPDRLALRRSAGDSSCRRAFLLWRGHARRRLLALHDTPPVGMTPIRRGEDYSAFPSFDYLTTLFHLADLVVAVGAAILMKRSARDSGGRRAAPQRRSRSRRCGSLAPVLRQKSVQGASG